MRFAIEKDLEHRCRLGWTVMLVALLAACGDLKSPAERLPSADGGGRDARSTDVGGRLENDGFPDDGANVGDKAVEVAVGWRHCCAVLTGGRVRCWGEGLYGRLGYANTSDIGFAETPASTGDVNVGRSVLHVAVGVFHSCAVLENGGLRCWGLGESGALGYGNVDTIGDDEAPAWAGDVDVGGFVVGVATGQAHTCALLEGGKVRCWGDNTYGQLGYGHTKTIGDDEVPESAGDVDVGGNVVQVSAGGDRTCALLDTGKVRCWGQGSPALGYGNSNSIGDDETPASAGDIDVGDAVTSISTGDDHTCAVLAGGRLRCWGDGSEGALGYGNTNEIGDDEAPSAAGDVRVGGPVLQVSASFAQTCAILEGGYARCWGRGDVGALGYGKGINGQAANIGDDETPASAGNIDVGGKVDWIGASWGVDTCARFTNGRLRCWGFPSLIFGTGHVVALPIGDDETPATGEDVRLF